MAYHGYAVVDRLIAVAVNAPEQAPAYAFVAARKLREVADHARCQDYRSRDHHHPAPVGHLGEDAGHLGVTGLGRTRATTVHAAFRQPLDPQPEPFAIACRGRDVAEQQLHPVPGCPSPAQPADLRPSDPVGKSEVVVCAMTPQEPIALIDEQNAPAHTPEVYGRREARGAPTDDDAIDLVVAFSGSHARIMRPSTFGSMAAAHQHSSPGSFRGAGRIPDRRPGNGGYDRLPPVRLKREQSR